MEQIKAVSELAILDGCLVKSIRMLENPVRLELLLETKNEQHIKLVISPHLNANLTEINVVVHSGLRILTTNLP